MKLNTKQKIRLYSWCVEEGVNLQYGKLSLCDLRNFNYSQLKTDRKYQVHCDDYTYSWSMIYDNLNSAVHKFLELKDKVKRVK